jgi:SAM-dependent methyltransferase
MGCGTGTITLGVAEVIHPGEVVGVDPSADAIDVARNWAAQVSHPDNVTFQVGDSHHVEFPDNTFDVVYSHTALHFFLDPVLGLQEQQRAAKKGGWVIASGVRDTGFRYPPCPQWEKLFEAFHPYWDARLQEYHASNKDPVTFLEEQSKSHPTSVFYFDIHAGRKCVEWFHMAGLTDIQINVQPRRVRYQRREGMRSHRLEGIRPNIFDLQYLDEPQSDDQQQMKSRLQEMIALGLLNDETLERAIEEIRAWYNHPGAVHFQPEVFAAGRVT